MLGRHRGDCSNVFRSGAGRSSDPGLADGRLASLVLHAQVSKGERVDVETARGSGGRSDLCLVALPQALLENPQTGS